MTSAAYLQERAAYSWPAAEVERLGGWLLRASSGVTKRANSVLALGDPGLPVVSAIAAVERWYAARSLPSRFQTFDGQSPADLDASLARAGYSRSEETLLMTAPLGTDRAAGAGEPDSAVRAPLRAESRAQRCPNGVELAADPSGEWLAAYDAAEPSPWDTALRAELLRRGTPPRRHAAVRVDGEIVALGRCVVDDGWAGIAAVVTRPEHRRRGHSRAVMDALLGWARTAGASSAYLQVMSGNEPAQGLYRSLGFTEHHRYAYHSRS